MFIEVSNPSIQTGFGERLVAGSRNRVTRFVVVEVHEHPITESSTIVEAKLTVEEFREFVRKGQMLLNTLDKQGRSASRRPRLFSHEDPSL